MTEFGSGDLPPAWIVVARIGDRLSEDHDDLTGLVRLLVVTQVVLPPLDRTLTLLNRKHPGVSVRIDVANSQDIVRAVSQKLSPFGFCLLAKPLAGLDCRPLLREEFGILPRADFNDGKFGQMH